MTWWAHRGIFKNIFSRPLFTIIFRPKMIKFHPYSILTRKGKVYFLIYCMLKHTFGQHELSSKISRNYLAFKMPCTYLEMHLPSTFHSGMTYKKNSSDVVTNLEFRIYDFFSEYLLWFIFQQANWDHKKFGFFFNNQTDKNSWKKLVKASDKFLVI
jgi:hypothetical protein